MPRKSHTHKYVKRPTGSNPVWACALPNCNHYMPYHLTTLVEGRMSLCWSCENQFMLDLDAMSEDKPRCMDCRGLIPVTIKEMVSNEPVEPTMSFEEKIKFITGEPKK